MNRDRSSLSEDSGTRKPGSEAPARFENKGLTPKPRQHGSLPSPSMKREA